MIDSPRLTIGELVARYIEFATSYYRSEDGPTGEAANIHFSTRLLVEMCGSMSVDGFGPKSLKNIRQAMIDKGLARTTINYRVHRIKRVFRWAVSEELAPPSLAHALDSVDGLRPGRSGAKESAPVKPIDDYVVASTVRQLGPVVADMVRVQRLTGCRPTEICTIRPCDIDRSQNVWVYRPAHHKTEYRGAVREIHIGPRAQAILEPYLRRQRDRYCFSPVESEAKRTEALRDRRKSKVQPSQKDRRKLNRQREPGQRYTPHGYRRAILRACKRAWVPAWSPNQLRHSAATEIRRTFGLEAAQLVLGHARADVTQVYAERNNRLAMEVMAKVG